MSRIVTDHAFIGILLWKAVGLHHRIQCSTAGIRVVDVHRMHGWMDKQGLHLAPHPCEGAGGQNQGQTMKLLKLLELFKLQRGIQHSKSHSELLKYS